jgi:hypothetical protein
LESGEQFGGPVHVAVLMENREMVELLMVNNPNDADCTCELAHFKMIEALRGKPRGEVWNSS